MKTLVVIFLFTLSFLLHADIRYVSKTGLSTPPYMSWETASDSIQKCLDICDNGDTVYVGSGVYKESLILNKEVWLIGISMDSTIIDGAGLAEFTVYIPSNVQILNIQNFTVLGAGAVGGSTVVHAYRNLNIYNCRIKRAYGGVGARGGVVHNLFITDVQSGIVGGCLLDTCHFVITNNIIMPNYDDAAGINMVPGGYYKIYNNVIITAVYQRLEGILLAFPHTFDIRNNLISGFSTGIDQHCQDSSYTYNNYITKCGTGIDLSSTKAITKNSIITNCANGFYSVVASSVFVDYNLLWQNLRTQQGTMTWGDSNKIADPMVMNPAIPDTSLVYNLYLQKYSPAIDAGDPNVIDKDGTRSDLGLYGGPFGETYNYQDLAPRAPRNVSAVVSGSMAVLNWFKNTEADTGYYNIYRDTVPNFTIDSTKLISRQKDTLFTESLPKTTKTLYYKLTAEDKQGNISQPSEEKVITYTSAEEKYEAVESYQLFQNYPNPFNPTTTISYRLKERGYIKLLVYDIKGELIKVLINNEQAAGYYEHGFDGSVLASGIYIYRLEVIGKGNIPVYSDMKKCIILK